MYITTMLQSQNVTEQKVTCIKSPARPISISLEPNGFGLTVDALVKPHFTYLTGKLLFAGCVLLRDRFCSPCSGLIELVPINFRRLSNQRQV
jgi:hypothetical protein